MSRYPDLEIQYIVILLRNLLGIFVVMAPYFPFVLLAFGFILNVSISQDIFGIIAGHSYYFLVDVFPKHPRGFKVRFEKNNVYFILIL